MTNEYLEERLRCIGKLYPNLYFFVTKQGPQIIRGKYGENDYDKKVCLIYRKYFKEVGRPSMQHLSLEQLKELNRICREETE